MATHHPEKPMMSADRKKMIALGALFGLLVIVSVWNFWPAPKRAVAPPPPEDGRVRNADLRTGAPAGESPAGDAS